VPLAAGSGTAAGAAAVGGAVCAALNSTDAAFVSTAAITRLSLFPN
jgi:hypothetical protein